MDAVLCRAVSAFRHHIEGIPVLGPASVAVQIAGDGVLDSVSTLMRGPTAQVLEKAKVLHPERALRQIGQQLAERFARSKDAVQLSSREGLRFVATVEVAHEQERQAFVMVVSATERSYLPLESPGAESLVAQSNKMTARRCC